MNRRLTTAVLTLAAIALSGCISLFPKAEPAQLYRFQAQPTAQPFPPGPLFGVLRLGASFPRASAGDRILTVNDRGEAAYIAGARWVSPASVLFEEQVLGVIELATFSPFNEVHTGFLDSEFKMTEPTEHTDEERVALLVAAVMSHNRRVRNGAQPAVISSPAQSWREAGRDRQLASRGAMAQQGNRWRRSTG